MTDDILPNACHALRNADACKGTAAMKCSVINDCYAVRNVNARKGSAIFKRPTFNTCHAIRNTNACKGTAIIKRIVSNTCNLIPVNFFRYFKFSFCCGVASFNRTAGSVFIYSIGQHAIRSRYRVFGTLRL